MALPRIGTRLYLSTGLCFALQGVIEKPLKSLERVARGKRQARVKRAPEASRPSRNLDFA